MPSYTYISHCPDTGMIVIHPEKRDWSDYSHNEHFMYHTSILDAVTSDKFYIRVDAAQVPYMALTHIRLFLMLARHARTHYKERLASVVVANATAVTRAIYNALLSAGALPEATAKKIVFV